MATNKPEINYLARDFETIKSQLVEYAKRYYPNQYNDFTDASFGSFLLDAVSYIGDVASFQLDYQSNENMLASAVNRDNIIKLARQLGYKAPLSPNVTGFVTVYLNVPSAASNAGPDLNYLPLLKQGTTFSTVEGAVFVLTEDVDFSEQGTDFVVSEVDDTTGIPTKYAAKRQAPVASGIIEQRTEVVEDRSTKSGFLKVDIAEEEVIEIISVTDTEGNVYYEVDSLTQDIIYKSFNNEGTTSSNTLKVMMPTVAARRFIVDFADGTVSLIFGNGKEDSSSALDSINDPTQVVLQKHGKDYISSTVLDPTVLTDNRQLGIGPSNTNLIITYRYNASDFLSAGANALNQVDSAEFTFPTTATDQATKDGVAASLEVENEDRIAGNRLEFTNDELKQLAASSYAAQNRIVTTQDYEAFSYRMPSQFGSICRAYAKRDDFSPRRSINLYVLSKDDDDALTVASQAIKDNLKTWLSRHKTISDSVDILNGRIINFGIRFSFVSSPNYSLIDARRAAEERLRFELDKRKYYFGESIDVSHLTKVINDVEQVIDVTKFEVYSITGSPYSDVEYDFIKNTTADGRFIKLPDDFIFEIKNLDATITGEAI